MKLRKKTDSSCSQNYSSNFFSRRKKVFFSSNMPYIQRQIDEKAGTTSESYNLVERAINGMTAGLTQPVLNSNEVISSSLSQMAGSTLSHLKFPEIKGHQVPDSQKISCNFGTLPDNETSSIVYLPTAGPWNKNVKQSAFRNLVTNLPVSVKRQHQNSVNNCSGDNETNLSFTTNDATSLVNKIKAHEEGHRNDVEEVYKDLLHPWDKRLGEVIAANTKKEGDDGQKCLAELWKEVGDNPGELATKLATKWLEKGAEFHRRETGQPTLSNARANSSCSHSFISIDM